MKFKFNRQLTLTIFTIALTMSAFAQDDLFLVRPIEVNSATIRKFFKTEQKPDVISGVLRLYKTGPGQRWITKEAAKQITVMSESTNWGVIAYPEVLKSEIEHGSYSLKITEFQTARQKEAISISRDKLRQIARDDRSLIFVQYNFVGYAPNTNAYQERGAWTPEMAKVLMTLMKDSGSEYLGTAGNTFLLAVPKGQEIPVISLLNRNGKYNLLYFANTTVDRVPPRVDTVACEEILGIDLK